MDHPRELSEPDVFPVQTSTEKVRLALAELAQAEPDNALQATMLGAIGTFAPMLELALPDDPEDLDAILLACAKWALAMRSDTAAPLETIDELFLGPEPDPDAEPAA
jgi:hypothetical protein